MSNTRFVVGIFAFAAAACGPKPVGNQIDASGGGGGGGGLTVDAPACATSVVTAEQVALDLYVMLDQSSSMDESVSGGTKWSAVTGALTTFLGQSGLTGVSVGLQYFGLPGPDGFDDSCTASDYAVADVEIAALPGVASAINSSLGQHSPSTATPTSAALQGAVDHAKSWAQAHTTDTVAVILATDGEPTECDTSLTSIDNIAKAAVMGTPSIPTFVIGVGSSTSNLNAIAAAGGTTSAFLVDTGGNVNQQFLDAMNAIRHAALGCVYSIPTGNGPVDYNEVNIVYQPGNGGQPVTLPYVMSKANCPATGNGWYYDNPAAPTQIILCDSSCSGIEVDQSGSVNITLGCATIVQ
ncbi:MAG TPA: vWA domain-containing protein [Kofleriaceae bacterium]